MIVNDYHIQNVLQAYGKQVNRSGNQQRAGRNDLLEQVDRVSLSTDAKKEQVISKTASEVIERITSKRKRSDFEREILHRLTREYKSEMNTKEVGLETSITFKVVDDQDQELVKSIDSKNSECLKRMLFEIPGQIIQK